MAAMRKHLQMEKCSCDATLKSHINLWKDVFGFLLWNIGHTDDHSKTLS
jgi:hypothetical protein